MAVAGARAEIMAKVGAGAENKLFRLRNIVFLQRIFRYCAVLTTFLIYLSVREKNKILFFETKFYLNLCFGHIFCLVFSGCTPRDVILHLQKQLEQELLKNRNLSQVS